MEFEDYEHLPETAPMYVTMTAGAVAGISEHCVMYPVDSIKTRMQSLDCGKQNLHGKSITESIRVIVREEGMLRPMRGFGAVVAGAGPAHALYFTCYEQVKNSLANSFPSLHHTLHQGLAAFSATFLHDAIMTPADVVKQRMQMCCSPFHSLFTAVSTIYATEGISAFYRSYLTSLAMNVPFQVTHFLAYERVTKLLNPTKEYNPPVHFLAGGLAGATAAIVTLPMDVCKTLLNTQEPSVLKRLHTKEVTGFITSAKIVYEFQGFGGFFRGLRPRILSQMPATAISWSVYEFFKYSIVNRYYSERDEDYDTLNDLMKDNLSDLIMTKSAIGSSAK